MKCNNRVTNSRFDKWLKSNVASECKYTFLFLQQATVRRLTLHQQRQREHKGAYLTVKQRECIHEFMFLPYRVHALLLAFRFCRILKHSNSTNQNQTLYPVSRGFFMALLFSVFPLAFQSRTWFVNHTARGENHQCQCHSCRGAFCDFGLIQVEEQV